jgi:hypothetical protein
MDETSMTPINYWHERFFKIVSITGFLLLLAVLTIIVRVGQATSYEFSIYDAYPWYFWAFLLSAVLCGQVVIFGSALSQSRKNYWLFGLMVILVSNALVICMPIIRGYYIYGSGDTLTHIGYMKDILRTSGIGENYYPVDHLLGVIFYVFSGLSFPDITLILPPLFSFFFVLSMYLVGKEMFQNTFELMILILLSSTLFWGSSLSFVPNAQAFFVVPLMVYLAFKMYNGNNAKKYHVLLLLTGFLMVFYHPLVTLLVILLLCIMQITQYILEKYEKRSLQKANYTYTILFMLAIFSIWSTYIAMATYVMKPIISRIFGEEIVKSEFQKNIDLVSQVNVDPLYLLKLILNVYGQSIILGVLSLLSIGLLLKSMKNQKTASNFYQGISILGFIILFILSIAMFFSNGRFGFGRIYSFAMLFSLLLIPMGVYLFIYEKIPGGTMRTRKTLVKLLAVFFIIFCIPYFSLFNVYDSPITKNTNLQVPRSDYIGMNTFLSFRNESLPILELGLVSYRFVDALYGKSAPRLNIYENKNMAPPNHFGYQNETLSGIFYQHPKYVITNDQGRRKNPYLNPEFEDKWSFSPKDFEQVKNDPKINQVYSNKNLEIFMLPG